MNYCKNNSRKEVMTCAKACKFFKNHGFYDVFLGFTLIFKVKIAQKKFWYLIVKKSALCIFR